MGLFAINPRSSWFHVLILFVYSRFVKLKIWYGYPKFSVDKVCKKYIAPTHRLCGQIGLQTRYAPLLPCSTVAANAYVPRRTWKLQLLCFTASRRENHIRFLIAIWYISDICLCCFSERSYDWMLMRSLFFLLWEFPNVYVAFIRTWKCPSGWFPRGINHSTQNSPKTVLMIEFWGIIFRYYGYISPKPLL